MCLVAVGYVVNESDVRYHDGWVLIVCLCVVFIARRKKPSVEIIDLALTAKLGNLSAVICTQHHLLTDFNIAGLLPVFFIH